MAGLFGYSVRGTNGTSESARSKASANAPQAKPRHRPPPDLAGRIGASGERRLLLRRCHVKGSIASIPMCRRRTAIPRAMRSLFRCCRTRPSSVQRTDGTGRASVTGDTAELAPPGSGRDCPVGVRFDHVGPRNKGRAECGWVTVIVVALIFFAASADRHSFAPPLRVRLGSGANATATVAQGLVHSLRTSV